MIKCKEDEIKGVLKALTLNSYIDVHNQFCELGKYPDDYVYGMDIFDDYFAGTEPLAMVMMIDQDIGFASNETYWAINGYGKVYSIGIRSEMPDLSDDIADYAVEYDFDFGVAYIRDILDR